MKMRSNAMRILIVIWLAALTHLVAEVDPCSCRKESNRSCPFLFPIPPVPTQSDAFLSPTPSQLFRLSLYKFRYGWLQAVTICLFVPSWICRSSHCYPV